jgi:hypothetical protein
MADYWHPDVVRAHHIAMQQKPISRNEAQDIEEKVRRDLTPFSSSYGKVN